MRGSSGVRSRAEEKVPDHVSRRIMTSRNADMLSRPDADIAS